MEFSNFSIRYQSVEEIKEKILLPLIENDNYESLLAPSAYDTAWLSMVPRPDDPFARPMFKSCLDWVLHNQRDDGSWGDEDDNNNDNDDDNSTIHSLLATLACVITLKKWNVGRINLRKGLKFMEINIEKVIGNNKEGSEFPYWFNIMFPSMVELAHHHGLDIVFSSYNSKIKFMDLFQKRQQILKSKELVDHNNYNRPLLLYLEALPSTYKVNEEDIVKSLNGDGSLFRSPSATARALMITGNKKCLLYLRSLVQRCPNGVPHMYPLDEEVIKISIVNQIERLGLAEIFKQETEEILAQLYRNYKNEELEANARNLVADKLNKDSLAFRILRMHGYNVSPWRFCWFLNDEEFLKNMEKNHKDFSNVMLNVYRATDVMFPEEYQLEAAKSFSMKILQKCLQDEQFLDKIKHPNFRKRIEHELSLPWVARLDHLEHRMWIERNDSNVFWMGKAFFHRLSTMNNNKLKRLAISNFEFQQSVYRLELDELKSWTNDLGLSDMGFGREKTAYCYFAIATSTSLPYNSVVRKIIAKEAILITVADDFFDTKGSLHDLEILTDAVRRWDAKLLKGHGKTIFTALDNLVRYVAIEHVKQKGTDITKELREIWYGTFLSWLTEAQWSKNGHVPSIDEYLETGMTSIAAHVLIFSASSFVDTCVTSNKLNPNHYETITKQVMLVTRLLNDLQSFEKEKEDGKKNSVLLHLRENPDKGIEESIAYIKDILDRNKKEFLQQALMEGFNDLSESSKRIHISCFKTFQMFFNSSNSFDSETDMIQDIQKAIFVPINIPNSNSNSISNSKSSKPCIVPINVPNSNSSKPCIVPINVPNSNSLKPRMIPINVPNSNSSRPRITVFKPSPTRVYKTNFSPAYFKLSFA